LFVSAGFSAHTKGESASVAPSPKPSAAARLLRSQARRPLSSLTSTNWSSCRAGDARRAANCNQREQIARQLGVPGDRRLSCGLIRCNLGIRPDLPQRATARRWRGSGSAKFPLAQKRVEQSEHKTYRDQSSASIPPSSAEIRLLDMLAVRGPARRLGIERDRGHSSRPRHGKVRREHRDGTRSLARKIPTIAPFMKM
jgi:hypothetical protein